MTHAYYNENDPKAAAWLRELIAAGHIAPGEVDQRSIKEVRAEDLVGFTQCHFFAGIGGWSYALRLAGWPDDRPVWTGSCPCQPFSASGKKKGFDDERHLWPDWFRLIRECRPGVVFGEQVASKPGLAWLDLVQADLEGADYAVGALDLCAAGIGAPHLRQRLWLCAYDLRSVQTIPDATSERRPRHEWWPGTPEESEPQSGVISHVLADEPQRGCREQRSQMEPRQVRHDDGGRELSGSVADQPPGEIRTRSGEVSAGSGKEESDRHGDGRVDGRMADGASPSGPEQQREQGGRKAPEVDSSEPRGSRELADGASGHPGPEGQQCRRQYRRKPEDGQSEQLEDKFGKRRGSGRKGDHSENDGRVFDAASGDDRPGPVNGRWRAADWLHCQDGKWRPVEPGTFPLAYGLPARLGRLRGYGNAIVPDLAAAFIEAAKEII